MVGKAGASGKTGAGKGIKKTKVDWRMPPGFKYESKRYWNKYYDLLNKEGILKETDFDSFVRLCKLYKMFKDVEKVVISKGSTYESKSDRGAFRVLKRPEAELALAYHREISNLEQKFGLNPKDREQIKAFTAAAKKTSSRDRWK